MTPIINPMFFYLAELCGTIKTITFIMAALLFIVSILVFIDCPTFLLYKDAKQRVLKRGTKALALSLIIFCTVGLILPSEDTLLKMLVAQNVTYENLEIAKNGGVDLVDYIIEKVDELNDGEAN